MVKHRQKTIAHREPAQAGWTHTWLAYGLLAALICVLLMPYLDGHWRLADDSYEFALPSWRFQQRVLELGQWPHWNLNEGFGKPTGINAGAMFYYPFVPLWGLVVGWSEISYLYFVGLHLALGAWLASRFARRLDLSLEAATFFALAFVGNGYVLGFFSNPALLFPYLWWPLLAEGLWDLHRERGTWAVPKIALALTLIESAGYPLTKLIIYASTALASLGLVRRHWKPLAASVAIALACTSPEWFTTLRTLPLSARMGSDIYDQVTYNSPTNFLALSTLLVPTAFLKRDGYQLGMTWLERSWWVGALTLGLIAAAFRSGALRLAPYKRLGWIALGAFLFAMGGHSFVRELSSELLPLLQHLRFANMARVVPMVLLVFLGAVSLNALQRGSSPKALVEPPPPRRKRLVGLWVGWLGACVACGLLTMDSDMLSDGLYLDPSTQWMLGGLHTVFYLLLAYTAYELRAGLNGRLSWAGVMVILQFLSLGDVGYAFRHLVSKEATRPLLGQESFEPASPQPNERSLKQWLDGDDWIHWDGNRKVFHAYTVPYHLWMLPSLQDPRVGRFASTLVSCQDNAEELGLRPGLDGAHSCAGTRFTIDRYYGNTIRISGTSSQPAWIMAHDFVDPGWSAQLNGVAVPIGRAFGRFKAVEVPAAAQWTLTFEYRDTAFPLLGWVSGFGFACLAATTALSALRRAAKSRT